MRLTALVGEGAYAEMQTSALDVRGFLDDTQQILRPTHPIAFGGVALAGPSATLALVRGGTNGRLVVSWSEPLKPVAREDTLTAEVACADVALDATQFEVTQAISTERPLGHAFLVAGESVTLALDPTAPPVALLQLRQHEPEVRVLAQNGKRTRIVWKRDDGIVFGWVPTPTVNRARDTLGELIDGPNLPLLSGDVFRGGICGFAFMPDPSPPAPPPAPVPPPPMEVTCDTDVRVVVAEAGPVALEAPERYVAGVIRAGAALQATGTAGVFTKVRLVDSEDDPQQPPGVDYLVSTRDLSACNARSQDR